MTIQTLKFSGSAVAMGPVAPLPGRPTVSVSYDEKVPLVRSVSGNLTLSDDTAVSIPFGTLTGVNWISVHALGAKVRLRVTSSDGTSQAVPVDPTLILRCDSVDITAIDVTRTSGVETEIFYVLGQKG